MHELGHSLGLSHSDKREAVMAPFYRGWDPYLKLSKDDKSAVQALYGPKRSVSSVPRSGPSIPKSVPMVPRYKIHKKSQRISTIEIDNSSKAGS